MKTIGVVGYGNLGKYLCQKIVNDQINFKLLYVWNRSPISNPESDSVLNEVDILTDLNDFKKYKTDLVIEVAHPIISELFGEKFLEHGSDYMIGSPTALADQNLLDRLKNASFKYERRIWVPCGAFWGASDIKKMSDKNTLKGLKITMKKHPNSLKLEGSLKQQLDSMLPLKDELIIYDGPVRELAKLAPNNVNTMAVGALVAQNLGFDKVKACLIADPSLTDKHLIEIEVTGPYNEDLKQHFLVLTTRSNPAIVGHVTGIQTYASFFNSLLEVLDDYNLFGVKIC